MDTSLWLTHLQQGSVKHYKVNTVVFLFRFKSHFYSDESFSLSKNIWIPKLTGQCKFHWFKIWYTDLNGHTPIWTKPTLTGTNHNLYLDRLYKRPQNQLLIPNSHLSFHGIRRYTINNTY